LKPSFGLQDQRAPVITSSLKIPYHGALSWFRATLSCSSSRRFHQISLQGELEPPAGNDPTSSRWGREALPLSYGRVVGDRGVEPRWRAFTEPAAPGASPVTGCAGGTCTLDLRRMRPTSCFCSTALQNHCRALHLLDNAPLHPRSREFQVAEGRGLDPQWLPIHPASNGRPAPAGLTFLDGGRLSARCPYALSVPRGFQPAPGPRPVSLP
jgi:hypothetical protein